MLYKNVTKVVIHLKILKDVETYWSSNFSDDYGKMRYISLLTTLFLDIFKSCDK